MFRLAFAAAAAALIAAPVASADQTEQTNNNSAAADHTVSGVTVTAAPKSSPLVDPASQFVKSHLPTNTNNQYARFHDPVCVRVIGLAPGFADLVAKRVMELGKEARAPISASKECKPNVNVIFTSSPQAQLDDIVKRRNILLGFYLPSELQKLKTFNRPIQAWYLTRSLDTHGNSALELYDPEPCISSGAPGAPPCDIKSPPLVGRAGSRLGNDLSSELVHSLILVDVSKVSGLKIGSVADYIAILALSRWQDLERCSSMRTILNLMANDCSDFAPEAATVADLGLLTGLYSSRPRDPGSFQRMTIASRIRNAVEKDAASPSP